MLPSSEMGKQSPMLETFEEALREHLAAIQDRDIERFAATLSHSEDVQVIGPDAGAVRGYDAVLAAHRGWFSSPFAWTFQPKVVWKQVTPQMGAALLDVDYREDGTRKEFLLLTLFRREPEGWRFLYDQNTARGLPS